MKKEDAKFLKMLSILGISFVGATTVACGGALTTYAFKKKPKAATVSPYIEKGKGLPLLAEGVHLRQGTHNVVLTDSFYEQYKANNKVEEWRQFFLDSMKEAYNTLNKYSSCVKFNFCTTNKELSEKYSVPLIDNVQKDDILIYATNQPINGNVSTVAITNWDYDKNTYELNNLKITFNKEAFFRFWKSDISAEKTMYAQNTVLYSFTIHETMHAMGLEHIYKRDSILNPVLYISTSVPNNEDIKLIDQYNVQFYNAKPIYSNIETETQNFQFNDYTLKMN